MRLGHPGRLNFVKNATPKRPSRTPSSVDLRYASSGDEVGAGELEHETREPE